MNLENITAIYGSPRKNGNTDLLLKALLRGIKDQGGNAHEIFLRDLKFSPCIGCGGCNDTGTCVLSDDMDTIYPHLIKSEIVILSAPVFFFGMNALAKAMVDRCQCLWARKYLINKPLSNERGVKGKGILLSVGGSKGKKNFDGILLTARYFYDALDMDFAHHLEYGSIDAKGAVSDHPTALDEAYNLGRQFLG
jgi:multimeric flavodoxin WrbA